MPSATGNKWDPPAVKQMMKEPHPRYQEPKAKRRKGEQDWGDLSLRSLMLGKAHLKLRSSKQYDSVLERATDFNGVTQAPYVHLGVDVLGGALGSALAPSQYQLVGVAAGVLLANWLYNTPVNIDIPLPRPADTGALAAAVAAAGRTSDWKFGQRPEEQYKPNPGEQEQEDAVGRASGELEDPDAGGEVEAGEGLLEELGEDVFAGAEQATKVLADAPIG